MDDPRLPLAIPFEGGLGPVRSPAMRRPVDRWTVSYEEGETNEVRVPHSWGQDVPLGWEGPAVYRTEIEAPDEPSRLRFHGVSYAAEVRIEGRLVAEHRGIWDAFDADLTPWRGRAAKVEVTVRRNGGATFPVSRVLSGFLPYVFAPFGGIFRPVEIVSAEEPLFVPAAAPRVAVAGRRITLDGDPFFVRGVLDWGWNPSGGAPTFAADELERQLRILRGRGFNLVKFCLYLPSHEHLALVRAAGLAAWIELPLWAPHPAIYDDPSVEEEIERIVRQYRGHDHIVAWTLGCELGAAPAAWRERMVAKVQALTGCPLVKDNSGGAEMYGGDPRESGTFEDYHPYADAIRFPALLDALAGDAERPVLLGETFDADVHRDLEEVHRRMPYWASGLAELNAKGVRWIHELPRLAREVPLRERNDELIAASVARAEFVRREAASAARLRGGVAGYVVTGLRDTPISTSGLLDDFGRSRFGADAMLAWNGPDALLISPRRATPWRAGGNEPRLADPFSIGLGPTLWPLVVHSERGLASRLLWRVLADGAVVAEGVGERTEIRPGERGRIGAAFWSAPTPGVRVLEAEFGPLFAAWTFVVAPPSKIEVSEGWDEAAMARHRAGSPQVVVVGASDAAFDPQPRPFWRESCPLFAAGASGSVRLPEAQRGVSTPLALGSGAAATVLGDGEDLMTRVDLRNYECRTYAYRAGRTVVTTLPLASQPGDAWTPVGAAPDLFRAWLADAVEG